MSLQHRFDSPDNIISGFAWRTESEYLLQAIQLLIRRFLINEHRPVSLHIAMSPDRANTSPGLTNTSFKHQQIQDLPDHIYPIGLLGRSEEHTSELQSILRNSYADFC